MLVETVEVESQTSLQVLNWPLWLRPSPRYREGGGCDLDSGAGVDQQWSPCGIVWVASPTVEPNSEDELHALIIMRNQLDKDTEEWEKLNYDIHTLRCARRQVFGRWRKILLQMGYQNEVDSLLEVNTERERENLYRASQLLHTLWEECSLFPVGFHTEEKYLSVMVGHTHHWWLITVYALIPNDVCKLDLIQ
uniref:Melanoregulin n=1 Tax=Paramormyrops kingsleyae TaxID=1676925 RepID=A0A3B3S284_9TELE